MVFQHVFQVSTPGRSMTDITSTVKTLVQESGTRKGVCTIFVHHTSASLFINENADPDVQLDLEDYLSRLVPDGDKQYRHDAEGPDDMAAHIRTVLTQTSISIPIIDGTCALGTWQGLYLWEHRAHPHQRRLSVTILGE